MPNQPTAKIDSNDKPTLLAWNETTSAPEAMRCDAIFNYLEIFFAASSVGTYTPINRSFIDGSSNCTLLGWNDTTGMVQALRCDDSGNLLVKIV